MNKPTYFTILARLLLLFLTLQLSQNFSHAQARKKTNWLEDKKAHISRWRIGAGVSISDLGVNAQFYKLSGICTKTIRVKKKFSFDVGVSQEGFLFRDLIASNNSSWSSGGIRANVDAKIYFPIIFNPYLGIGTEFGTRKFNGISEFHYDAVGRLGIEQKLLGFKVSTKSMLHIGGFIEAKYNFSLSENFSYIIPSIGLRIHFL
jgi:hypothetical protein